MKTINKLMTNNEIYSLALGMSKSFNDNETYMPAALAYGIQKNKSTLLSIAEEIEKSRLNIVQHYSKGQDDDHYIIDPEFVDTANKELDDLLNVEQEVKIYMCNIEEFNDIKFTSVQMQSLMFMINEE